MRTVLPVLGTGFQRRRGWGVLGSLSLWLAGLVLFAATAEAADDPKGMLDAAYELTKSAKSIEQYDEIIRRCQAAQQAKLDSELEDYSKRLLAWAHNRRGEAYTEKAAEKSNRAQAQLGDRQTAAVLEAERKQAQALDAAALADFEKAVEYEPTRWKAVHNRGVSYAIAGRYEDALRDFDRVTQLKPDYANAWFNRGEIRFELRQFEGALRDYEEVLNLSPDDPGALTGRARSLLRLDRGREGISDLSKAAKLTPANAEVFAVRGEIYEQVGDWEKAARDFQKAIEIDPYSGHAYVAVAWMLATCPDVKYRNENMALEAAQKAIDLDGPERDFRHLDVMAAALANASKFQEAKKFIDEAIQAAPPAELAALRKRQALYAQNKPYRMEPATEK